ncbi:DUF3859 domain-containing protein [Mucilaginibacter sp. Mucisp86]|uniref:DUF3859 domain-containing protein n=1 Tax=Mucilaginibacter sp. Mucisp86 TaxID=3243060 RepID=UPI0039B6B8FC
MIKPLSLGLIVSMLLISSCTNAQHAMVHKFAITEISYGIYTSKIVAKEPIAGSPTGNHNVTRNSILIKQTQRVPAKLGIQFGAEYKVAADGNDTVRVEVEWVFPETHDPAGRITNTSLKYPLAIPANMVNNSNYTLEKKQEVLKGSWVLNIYHDGKIVYSKKFDLY